MTPSSRWAVIVAAMMQAPSAGFAQATVSQIPLGQGLVLVSTLRFPDGDRENVVTVEDATPAGVTYTWHLAHHRTSGERTEASFHRFVRAADLAGAPRLNTVFWSEDRADYPGYTAFSISSAVYRQLRAAGEAPFTVTELNGSGPFDGLIGAAGSIVPGAGLLQSKVTLKGALSRVSPLAEPFPLLVSGRRVTVPALRLRGRFAFQERRLEQVFWVLTDSVHPLILKVVTGRDTFQMVRVELPDGGGAPAAVASVERELGSECRAELPGIYFGFGTAELDPASDRTLAGVAGILSRHPDWTLSIEGHTDSVGSAAANHALSERRAEAVRTSLAGRHGVSPVHLRASGYGASKPRESNSTLEGRARNRRVELVRPCGSTHQGANP